MRRRIISIALIFSLMFQLTVSYSCAATSVFSKWKDKVKDITHIDVKGWYEELDFTKYEKGWNKATKYVSSAFGKEIGKEYIDDVCGAIKNFKNEMNASYGSARGVAQEAGFVAEKWHAGTFDIDSVANDSKYKAKRKNSNKLASEDLTTNYKETASLKYYSSAKGSADAQCKSVLEAYSEYKRKTENPMELSEYLDAYGFDEETKENLYSSIYKGQTRIIPADQLDEAKAYLEGRITKLSNIPGENSKARTKAYQETLDNLKDRLEAPDGTSSKEISNEDLQAITELCQEGDFEPEQFGISTSQVITPKYVVKQAVGAGASAAVLSCVLETGPELYSVISQGVKNGEIDSEALKETGIDGFITAGEGFLEGSVSCALVTMCNSGKLGSNLVDANPDTIGTLTVLTIDGIRYGYALSNGEITADDYGNLMAEEILVAVVSQGSGAAMQALLPMIPFSYMVGCFVGGILASAGFEMVAPMVIAIKDGAGFEAVVPTVAVKTLNVGKKKISKMNIKNQATKAKDFAVSTTKKGYIRIKSIV